MILDTRDAFRGVLSGVIVVTCSASISSGTGAVAKSCSSTLIVFGISGSITTLLSFIDTNRFVTPTFPFFSSDTVGVHD